MQTPPQVAELFQLFTNSAIDYALYTVNTDGTIATWNYGAQRLFGYHNEEAIGHPQEILYPPDAVTRGEPEHELTAAREQGLHEAEGYRKRQDGDLLSVYTVTTALRDAEHQLTGYAVVTRNLSENRRALLELQDQKHRLKSIVETAVDAIVIIDEMGLIESFNPAGERLFGYREDEVIGHNVNMLMPEPYATEHTGYLQRYLRTGQAKVIGIGREVQARRKDGTLFAADLAVSELHDGKLLFTGILRDITERKRMEAEILHIAEAEQRRIGQELHDDAQQQLTGLAMIARHAADSLAALVSENPHLADIVSKVDRVANGLRDTNQSLRVLARGLVPVQIEAHGLRYALSRLAEQIHETHGVECVFTATDGVDIDDNRAATHLYRITQEAVNNSLQHGAASRIAINLLHSDRRLFLEIVDNGCGLPDNHESPGRGLQIMAYRAGLIGGVLAVHRKEEGGTVVRCSLPLY